MKSVRYFFLIITLYGNTTFTQNLIPNIVSTYNDNSVKKIINHKITGKKIIQDSYQLFREDGTLILEGKLKDGIEHGQGSYYDENGRKYTGEFKCREKHSEGTSVLNGKKTVCRFIESIPRGFDTNKNYVGIYYVHYKDENSSPFVSYLSLN